MRNTAFALLLPVLLVFAALPAAACDLDIAIQGAKGDAVLYGQVFADAASFAKAKGGLVAFTLAPHSTAAIALKGLPAGHYAVAAFEDTNGNGTLDKSFLGVPQEPYGFSNGATGTMGPPDFDRAAVACAGASATATVPLH